MIEFPSYDEERDLVRRAHTADVSETRFDVEAGLQDVLDRVEVQTVTLRRTVTTRVAVGGSHPTVVELTSEPSWAHLTGADRQAACLRAAARGDREAFDELIVDLAPLVWHVARGNGLSRTQAEDVVQTVWLTLLRQVNRFADPRALSGWLIVTTRREAEKVRVRREHLQLVAAPADSPAEVVVRTERDRRLWSAFHRLSPRCQELLRLTVLAGRAEYRAVAEALHMPHGSIGPTRGRCLNTLRSLYGEETDA